MRGLLEIEASSGSLLVPPELASTVETERNVPIRPADLERLLRAEQGLSEADREHWSSLTRMLAAVFHHDFHEKLIQLKDLYSPLDPDCDCIHLDHHSRQLTGRADEAFLRPLQEMLIRANYRLLDLKRLEEAISAPNERGLNYIPNFELFEHLQVWYRGACQVTREVRSWRRGFRKQSFTYEGYRRLVVILKFQNDSKKLGEYVRADVLYLRMFKDVPFVDMEMHLPEQGTKVRMRAIDKAQIASPVVISLPTMLYKLLFKLTLASIYTLPTIGLGTLLIAPISAGVNSFFGFQRARQRHLHRMIRHLYYLTLANNASVIGRVVDSAEEEELKEALLAYFMLWRNPETPLDHAALDRAVEDFLFERTGIRIDFEIHDALGKLRRLGLICEDDQGRYSAVPIDEALKRLDRRWDHYYHYDNAPAPKPD